MHVTGTFAGAGADGGSLGIDISYGKDVAIGTLTTSGQKAEISKIANGTCYIRADAPFYAALKVPASAIPVVAGKYVVVGAATPGFSTFVKLLQKSAVFGGDIKSNTTLTSQTVTGPTTVDDVKCFGIVVSGAAFYAAAEGDPLPIQVKFDANDQLDYDHYGAAVNVPTPAPGEVVQLPT